MRSFLIPMPRPLCRKLKKICLFIKRKAEIAATCCTRVYPQTTQIRVRWPLRGGGGGCTRRPRPLLRGASLVPTIPDRQTVCFWDQQPTHTPSLFISTRLGSASALYLRHRGHTRAWAPRDARSRDSSSVDPSTSRLLAVATCLGAQRMCVLIASLRGLARRPRSAAGPRQTRRASRRSVEE